MKKETAIKAFGSPAELAKALGISPAAVYQWGEYVPRLRVYELRELGVTEEGEVERISGIRREEIRPDLYPIDENLCRDISVSTHDAIVPMRKAG